MKRILAVVLFAGAIVLALAITREAQTTASPAPACSTCRTYCDNYCVKHNSFCRYAAPMCYSNDCGPGACSFICDSGETASYSCDCPTCPTPPGGSPIFRKQPTSPAS